MWNLDEIVRQNAPKERPIRTHRNAMDAAAAEAEATADRSDVMTLRTARDALAYLQERMRKADCTLGQLKGVDATTKFGRFSRVLELDEAIREIESRLPPAAEDPQTPNRPD